MRQSARASTTFFPRPKTQSDGWWLFALAVLTTILAAWAVGDFSSPLSDGDDTDQYEYVGYYLFKNISFWPWPHVNLVNNQTFYPYGTNQVFLPWGFERDYWYAFCYWLNGGPGPYLQYYYVFSLVLTAVGTFWLLRPFFPGWQLFLVGLIVSVFNFYGLWKYPVHLNVCVGHWTILCIVATYRLLLAANVGLHVKQDRLVMKDWAGQPVGVGISLSFLLLWAFLHIQVLGLELGYVAGFALTFTTLTLPVIAYLWIRQFPAVKQWPELVLAYLGSEFQQRKGAVWIMIFLLLLSLYAYLPLTFQIAFTAWEFDFGVVEPSRAWSHPLRLFIPFLPGVDQYAVQYERFFKDTYETYGQTSPGLYLVIGAGVGLWQSRRQVALWLPIVLMLVLCLVYHPVLLPTLKIFPWFSFNRHGGRASLVYPVLFCLLALPLRWPVRKSGKIAVWLLGVLMLLEWLHGYRFFLLYEIPPLSKPFYRYMNYVRQAPGEAIMDWPFCVVGADGTGMKEGMCPHYEEQNAVFTFRRFYDKKVVGQYFGRLHPDQLKPFLRDGWPRLLSPSHTFTAEDWQFFDNYLRKNNFAGVNLYPDLLPPGMAAQFYEHYGQPVAETRLPSAGRVQFLPISPKLNP